MSVVGEVIGARIRETREAHGLSRYALSKASGINRTNIVRTESGAHVPRFDTVVCIAKALGVQPSHLLCVLDGVQ